jgi:NADPH-dependent 2,4-dienoyl-CoA reductase/sulfur reductase-like enzyme
MKRLNRRQFTAGLGGLAVASVSGIATRSPALALGEAKVVIIGGGPAGATAAVTLKRADPQLDITLIEPKSQFTTCFFSNHYIAGLRSFDSITHGYHGLRALGIKVIHDVATQIEISRKRVAIGRGKALEYDRLVVAPGIEVKLDSIEGYSEAAAEVMPHAWQGGIQTKILKRRLEKLEDGGLVVMSAPRNPYRCPPGPYERACVIAHHLKTKKPKSKLIILDAKMTYSKQPVFEEAFNKYYGGIVEHHLTNDIDDYTVTRVAAEDGEIWTKAGETFKAALANIIPDQRAGRIAVDAGLTEGDWCPIDPTNFASTKAEHVFVIGDAAISDGMPKSAFSAHSQAVAVAGHILADLSQKERPEARYRNTCWSWLAPEDSVKIGADFAPGEVNGRLGLAASGSFVSKTGETPELRKANFNDSIAWYQTLISDVYPTNKLPAKDKGSVDADHG